MQIIGALVGGVGFLFIRLHGQNRIALIVTTIGASAFLVGFLVEHFSLPHSKSLDWQMLPFSAIPRNSRETAAVVVVLFLLTTFISLMLIMWQLSGNVPVFTTLAGILGMICAYFWYQNRGLPWSRNISIALLFLTVAVVAWKSFT